MGSQLIVGHHEAGYLNAPRFSLHPNMVRGLMRFVGGFVLFLASIALAWPAAAEAQNPAASLIHHHDATRPDYLRDLLLGGDVSIRLPPPPRGQPPAVVRGVYLNAWVFGSTRFNDLVALADSTEINAFVIDVKDGTGYFTYRSSLPLAVSIGANRELRARDTRRRLAILREHGIHPIARIVVAKDPLLAVERPHWAIQDIDGGIWRDRFGTPWVDTHRDSVWMYAADVAAEAVLMGFREVQFDYVRFPDDRPEFLARAVYPSNQANRTRRSAIRRYLNLLRERIGDLGVPFTISVFGLTTSATNDLGIGQYWDDLVTAADVVLPMVYPSHYSRGAFGFRRPNAEPYEVVRRAIEAGLRRSAEFRDAARIRPYLQSFTLGRPRYTAAEVRAQIDAVEGLGLTDWILWNASGRYPAGALRTIGGVAQTASPQEVLEAVTMQRERVPVPRP